MEPMFVRRSLSGFASITSCVCSLLALTACNDSTPSSQMDADASVTPFDAGVVVDGGESADAADGEAACVSATSVAATEDLNTFAAEGKVDGHNCSATDLLVSAEKYTTGRILLKFNVGDAAAAKLTSGEVQNLRLHVTLGSASANAGSLPCLLGPIGNQFGNNCLFAFSACPMISIWTEAPETSCATQLLENPSTSTGWPPDAFSTSCAHGTPIDFAVATSHADEVVEIPLSAAVLGPAVTGGTVSIYMPPLSAYSSFRIHSHESGDPAKRPQLMFTCNP